MSRDDAQSERLRAYARDHGHEIAGEYVDPGFAGDTEDRLAFRRFLADARDRQFEVVLVYRFDRIFREVRRFLNAEHELRQHGIRLISITGTIDHTHEGLEGGLFLGRILFIPGWYGRAWQQVLVW